jgi:hypothetical protein
MNDDIFHNPENTIFNYVNEATGKINCAKAGKILAVNDDGTATVELFDGTKLNCILFCLAGANAFIDFEDYKGSHCLVVFNDDDLTRFKTQNNTFKDIDARKHTLNNGIALSGLFPFNKRPKGKNHFVSYEQLNEILTKYTEQINSWQTNLKTSLTTATAAGNGAPITWINALPQATAKIDIATSKVEGIIHND